jgi:hypothetical protein
MTFDGCQESPGCLISRFDLLIYQELYQPLRLQPVVSSWPAVWQHVPQCIE